MADGAQLEAGSTGDAAATTNGGTAHKLLDGHWWKEKTTTAEHTAMGLIHKGKDQAEHAIHSPQAQHAAHVATDVAMDASRSEREQIHSAVKTGKHGDIVGAAIQAAPVAGEALTPHLTLMRKIKEQAFKHADEQASSTGNNNHNAEVKRILGHVHIDDAGEKNSPKR